MIEEHMTLEFNHVMIEEHMPNEDSKILLNDKKKSAGKKVSITNKKNSDIVNMLKIEYDNFVKQTSAKRKKIRSFKPFEIRMKALKINEYFSLKILDQAKIYLIFRDGKRKLKLNIGMVLDHNNVVDTDLVKVTDVATEGVESLHRKLNTENEHLFKNRQTPPTPPPSKTSQKRNIKVVTPASLRSSYD